MSITNPRQPISTRQFEGSNPWDGVLAAERWLTEHGFSVGREQAGAPRGIMRGDFDIQKWRNLSEENRSGLDGTMEMDVRTGAVTVTLYVEAPAAPVRTGA